QWYLFAKLKSQICESFGKMFYNIVEDSGLTWFFYVMLDISRNNSRITGGLKWHE
ncbi:MAG: hypothetical protein XE02_1035, partial [Mesotoga infera]